MRHGGGRSRSDRRGRRRFRRHGRRIRRALLGLLAVTVGIALVVSVLAAGWLTHVARSFDARTTTITDPFPSGKRPAASATGALNILLIGSDARADDERVAGGRSDALLLLHIAGDRKSADVLSIMRDSWVDVPGRGMAKINAAYSWGGVPLTVQTVEQLLDVRIDHVAEIGFAGFVGMTDALGGVDVDVRADFTARGHTFHQGTDHLDGAAALAFVRERYAFADGDHTRVKNQQAFLKGIATGLASRGTLTNPTRIGEFVGVTADHLSVDPGFTSSSIASIAWSARSIAPADVRYRTVPTAGGGTSADGQSYLTINTVALRSLSSALRADRLSDDELGAGAGR